jgi:hypothetical protein
MEIQRVRTADNFAISGITSAELLTIRIALLDLANDVEQPKHRRDEAKRFHDAFTTA